MRDSASSTDMSACQCEPNNREDRPPVSRLMSMAPNFFCLFCQLCTQDDMTTCLSYHMALKASVQKVHGPSHKIVRMTWLETQLLNKTSPYSHGL